MELWLDQGDPVSYHRRPVTGWNLDAMRAAVDDGWDEPFDVLLLETADTGLSRCNQCRRRLRSHREVALICLMARPDDNMVDGAAYCRRCVAAHGAQALAALLLEREPRRGRA